MPGIIISMFAAKALADLGVKLGPWEYASMIFCAIALVIGLSGSSLTKGFIGVGLAILLACVGVDPMLGRGRFTFEFDRYEEAPAEIAQKIIEERKAELEE